MASFDFERIVGAVAVGIVVHAADGRIVYANAAAAELLGASPAALCAVPVDAPWNIRGLDGELVPRHELPAFAALASGERFAGPPLELVRGDGSKVWVIAVAMPLGGEPRHVVVSFMDASAERRRFEDARAALTRAERRTEAVLRAMSEGLIIYDSAGRAEFINAGAMLMLGLTRAEIAGEATPEPAVGLVALDGTPLPPTETPVAVTLRTGRAIDAVVGVDRQDGRRVWLRVSSDLIAGEGDLSQGVVVNFADITPLREAQLLQERALAQQAAINNAMPGLIFQYRRDADGRPSFPYVGGQLDALPAVQGLRGTAAIDVVRRMIPAEDMPGIRAAFERSRVAGTRLDHLVRLCTGGGERWLRVRASPEGAGQATVWTGVALDVTEEQALAEAVRRAQRRDAMGDLAAGIAHNFNNMLAVILPNIEVAREIGRGLAPAADDLLRDAAMAATRASELVKQLLLLARGTSGSLAGIADLRDVVRDAANLCRRTFDRGITIDTRLEVGPGPAMTRGPLGHLVQVVVNLCINARDALEGRPTPRIDLQLARVEAPLADAPAHFELRVRDNGIGMPPDVVARLGEPFFTTKPPGRGTGLGLATVYNTLRDLGGTVEVSSIPGQGTTFVLRCPSVDAPVADRDGTAPLPTVTGRRVLVVEDEALVRRVVRRQLERDGHQVEEASSGAEALALLDGGVEVDVVLLDLSMPGMSGAETLRHIRARGPAPPVIIMSGDATLRPDLAGAAAVLQKPVPRSALLAAIDDVTRPPG